MNNHIQVVTTIDTEEGAQRIARALVEQRLAACVQVRGPISSTYRWQGEIETAEEWQCVAKTRGGHYDRVERAIIALHPYEVPEILAVPVMAESQSYADWLDEQVG